MCVCLGYKGVGELPTAVTQTRHDGSFSRGRLRVDAKLVQVLVGVHRHDVLRLWAHRRHHEDHQQGHKHAWRGAGEVWSPASLLHLDMVEPTWKAMLGHTFDKVFDPHVRFDVQCRHRTPRHKPLGLG